MILSTRQMSYDKATNTMVVEASCLRIEGYQSVFMVKSHRTGATVRFVHEQTIRDGEGDVMSAVYRGDNGVGLEILND